MEWFLSLIESMPVWLSAVTALVVAANGITALTPTKLDNKILNGLSLVLNFLAMNFGKNRNADADG